jgi:steroid delta-isomerase
MTQHTPHPAVRANMQSTEYAMAGDKTAWLALYADDAVVADPVGISPLDPQGSGHRGKAAIEKFWDTVIGPANLTLTVHQRCPSGSDTCAVSMTAENNLGNGIQTRIDMIAVYEVDKDGKISSMKAYWNWDEMAEQLVKLGLG